jgi:hypothetical protein
MSTLRRNDLLAMLSVIENLKDAIEQFEQGEISLLQAMQRIQDTTARVRAA